MNSRPNFFPGGQPLSSTRLNDVYQNIYLDCVSLIGCIDASGTLVKDGLYDILDRRLDIVASGILMDYDDRISYTLQVEEEFEGYNV